MSARGPLRPDDVLEVDPKVDLFRADERVVGVGPTGVFALEDLDIDGLRAALVLVDGRRTVAEICTMLSRRYDADDVAALLNQLHGVVVQCIGGAASSGRAGSGVVPVATRVRVAVVGAGTTASRIVAELGRSRFVVPVAEMSLQMSLQATRDDDDRARPAHGRVARLLTPRMDEPRGEAALSSSDLESRLEGAALVVCALEDVQGRSFLDVGEAATRAGVPVLFVAFERGACNVGPLHVPGRSPCFGCAQLSTTLKEIFDSSGPAIMPLLTFEAPPSDAPSHWLDRVAFEVCQEVERAVLGVPYPARLGSVLSIASSGEAVVRRVQVVATCPACHGTLGAAIVDATASPDGLVERDSAFVCDTTGGSRTVAPDDAQRRALAAFERLDIDVSCRPLPDDAPDALAAFGCPFFSLEAEARFRAGATVVFPTFKGPCFGKGTTELQAGCSAYFEWFERNLADWRGDRDLVRAPWERVRDQAIDMPFFVSGLLPGLEVRGRRAFDPQEPIDWVWGRCLRRDKPILVPATAVFLCGTMFRGSALEIPRAGSSGLSAGCSAGDAVLQGLLEIVERDATFTAIRNGVIHAAIAPESVDEPATSALLARIQASGYEAHLRDITSAIAIPTVEAYLVKPGEYGNHFAMGYGAHLDPRVAMRRAVTEAVQTLFGGAPAGVVDPIRADSSYFEAFPHRQQVLQRRGTERARAATPGVAASPVWAQIDAVVARIAAAIPRADVCAIDLSHRDLPGVHVVRTLVTGALDEARSVQLHIPERCRLRPLDEMYLGRIAM